MVKGTEAQYRFIVPHTLLNILFKNPLNDLFLLSRVKESISLSMILKAKVDKERCCFKKDISSLISKYVLLLVLSIHLLFYQILNIKKNCYN